MRVMDLADPRWFAVDLHVPDRRFSMLRVDDVDKPPFLDVRWDIEWKAAVALPADDVPTTPPANVAWLFHTSFCASTLLARALHVAPHTVTLKEPFVLRRLADARKSGWSVDDLLPRAVHLLGRGPCVVIKPTHVALNLAIDLMKATPNSRGIVMTSSLLDFMVSNLKKLPESQAKIPELAARAIAASSLRVTAAAPDLVCASALQWAAQRELMFQVLAAVGPARLRPLDASQYLPDVVAGTRAVAKFLELPIPDAELAAHAAACAARHAKAETAAYSPAQRAHEAIEMANSHRDALARARAWLHEHVLPQMTPAARAGA